MATTGRTSLLRTVLGGIAALGAVATVVLLERKRPLRPDTEPKLRRNARNLAVAGLGAAAIRLVEQPIVQPVARLVQRRRWGLLPALRLPVWLERTLAALLLDYTLYVWHILTHRAPFLWRFHLVHHVDLDLDASTAVRFHFGELVLSTVWRTAQIVVIGVSPGSLSLWNRLLMVSIVFHHSNIHLPPGLERLLERVIMTPRLHGIHHSAREQDTNSNWSSGLIWWDMLHGTFRRGIPQRSITIGVPAYRDPKELELPEILELPFVEQHDVWASPTPRATAGLQE